MGEYPKVERVSVPGTSVSYINPKYPCFVHRDYRYYEPEGNPNINNRPHYYSNWVVSELNTGAAITTGKTRAQAIENAKGKLKEVGDQGMEIAIKAYKERLAKYDLAAKGN